jgi:hypothetical protein
MGRAIDFRAKHAEQVPLIGRREELARLAASLRHRQTRLIVGPPGSGKTRLAHEAITLSGESALVVERTDVLHDLLVQMAERLGLDSSSSSTGRPATSVALKARVLNCLRRDPQCIVLENVTNADPRMYRFLQHVFYLPETCLVVTARSRESLGHVRKLLWDPRLEIGLPPLGMLEALRLFETAVAFYRLEGLDLDDFRPKVLASAQGNPGQILAMCRLAGRPEYQHGRYIKFLPLRIDVLSSFVL